MVNISIKQYLKIPESHQKHKMEQEGLSLFSLAFTFDFKKHAWDENCVLNSDPVTMLKLPELCPECQPGSGGYCFFPRGCQFNSLNALHVPDIQETMKWRRHYPCLQGAYRIVDISVCIIFFELSKSEQVFCFSVEIMTIWSLLTLGKGSLWKSVCVSWFLGFPSFWQLFLLEM